MRILELLLNGSPSRGHRVALCLLATWGATSVVWAQTYVSGVIGSNTAWTTAGSPYIVTGNTVLLESCTLTVAPGVVVKFNADVTLDVRGRLLCQGSLADSIRFIPVGNSRWDGIRINNQFDARVEWNYVRATFSTYLFQPASSGGVADTLLILRNSLCDDVGVVVLQWDVPKQYTVYVDSCVSINTTGYWCEGAGNFTFKNSKFMGHQSVLYNSTNQPTLIENCEFSYNNRAIMVVGSVNNSVFHNNGQAISTMNNVHPQVHGCYVYENEIGIYAWNYNATNPVNQITNNRICNNVHNVKKVYDVDTYVVNNCFCLSDSSQIAETIFDFFDDGSLGLVFFTPFDTTCLDQFDGVTEHDSALLVNVFPNPTDGMLNFSTEVNGLIDVLLYDSQSRLLLQRRFYRTCLVDLHELSPGVYVYEVSGPDGYLNKGWVVKD